MAKETNKSANDETKQNDASSGEQTADETAQASGEQTGAQSSEQTNVQAAGTEQADEQSGGVIGGIFDTVSSVISTVAETVSSVAETAVGVAGTAVNVVTTGTTSGETAAEPVKTNRRAQKIGTVTSDKMTKTVVVNVDRQIMHPKYRRYVRRRTKFMAHDEMGAAIGDKVRIEETRPLSARKRWRVIEIVQKAAR